MRVEKQKLPEKSMKYINAKRAQSWSKKVKLVKEYYDMFGERICHTMKNSECNQVSFPFFNQENLAQCPRTDLNKRFLPRTKTITT